MPVRDAWNLVPFEPSPDQVIRIGWISAALGFLIAIVSAIGEFAGWWNLVGEIGMTVGSLLGIVATFTTLAFTAGRDQIEAVHATMEGLEGTVQSVGSTTEANHELLQDNNETLSEASEKLDKLDKLDDLDKLDLIEAELNRQTGVLDRQVEILDAIHSDL